MKVEDAIAYAKEISSMEQMSGERAAAPILYNALVFSRVDGLSDQEKTNWLKIARAMGCSEDLIDEMIAVYQLEVEFTKRMERLMLGDKARSFEFKGCSDEFKK